MPINTADLSLPNLYFISFSKPQYPIKSCHIAFFDGDRIKVLLINHFNVLLRSPRFKPERSTRILKGHLALGVGQISEFSPHYNCKMIAKVAWRYLSAIYSQKCSQSFPIPILHVFSLRRAKKPERGVSCKSALFTIASQNGCYSKNKLVRSPPTNIRVQWGGPRQQNPHGRHFW
jgi:hypothetical protein